MNKYDQLTLLDCTLRDGGYYNNWNFPLNQVNRYLQAMNEIDVSCIEIGFRFKVGEKKLGAFAYSSDDFLEGLNLSKEKIYGVMVNGKDFIDKENLSKSVKGLFKRKDESKISLVRIAINFDNALEVEDLAKHLKDLGYIVGLNLMQAGYKESKDYSNLAKQISSWSTIDVLYFADSLGNMNPNEVKRISEVLKKNWEGNLGIHTHNNKGLALINTLSAIQHGVTWCDSTLTGMGRGAGNVQTENLILELKPKGNFLKLQQSLSDFNSLKETYNWGTNFHYHYAASNDIHPTYVQTLLSDNRYNINQISSILEFLSTNESKSFSEDSLNHAVFTENKDLEGTWDATDWLLNEEVLLVGAGKSVKNELAKIEKYIEENNVKVICLNKNNFIKDSYVDAVVVSHVLRVALDSELLGNLKCPLIMPKSRIGHLMGKKINKLEILDYGMTQKKGAFEIYKKGCKLNSPLAAAYALAVITQAGAKRISLIGFDGYSKEDSRQKEMDYVFNSYNSQKNKLPLLSLTSTSYEVNEDLLL